jgi:hypothetical protein
VLVTDQRSRQELSPRFSYPFYELLQDNPVLRGTAARGSVGLTATANGEVGRVSGELVSGN